jgi:type VI secretion system VgrG family protein
MDFRERKEFTFISKALPEDTFSVVKFSGIDAISKPYEFDITLSSQDPEIDLKAVLQNSATLAIIHGGAELPFHGVLAEFEQLHEVKQHAFYRAILVPKLWNAGLYHENQIFLDKTVPQIIEEILKQVGMAGQDYEFNLTRSYPAWEHVCQYQETNLDFISRWMEREGIYYFFEQTEKGAKMVVSDNLSIHKDIHGDPDIPYSPPSGLIASEKEIVKEFVCRQKMLPAKVILKDHNYRKPGLEIKAEAAVDPNGRGEIYVYGEHFKDSEQGNELAKIRAEEILCKEREFHGEATASAFSPGYIFELSEHYRSEYNRRYLLLEITHQGSRSEDLLAGLGKEKSRQEETAGYSNRFVCIPADVQFRPERRTQKPKFYGTMNAFVDAAGDGKYAELDEQGRYKVILPFDLSGRKGGKASRFIRMAQPYAGFTATDGVKGPSGMHFPLHKNAEVLLTFVDGDPDRPIISNSIPNPETVSPVIKENQTQSVIRDNYGNELILDSTPDDEHIRLYSPHHNSGLELGRSTWKWSTSDTIECACGNSWGLTIGNKVDFTAGSYTDIKAGFINEVILGYNLNLKLGINQTIDHALDIKSSYEPIVQCSEKDILSAAGQDQVLSAGDQVCIIGGESRSKTDEDLEAEVFGSRKGPKPNPVEVSKAMANRNNPQKFQNRSIINVFPEKMIMSVSNKEDTFKIDNVSRKPNGGNIPEEIFSKTPPQKFLAKYAIISSVATILSSVITQVIQKEDKPAIGGISGVVTTVFAGFLMNRMKKYAKQYTNDEAIEPVGHKNPAAMIELDHKGKVRINSKSKSVVIRVGKNEANSEGAGLAISESDVWLARKDKLDGPMAQNKSMLKLEKSGNVFLVAEKDSVIKAESNLYLRGKVVYGPGGNLKILK